MLRSLAKLGSVAKMKTSPASQPRTHDFFSETDDVVQLRSACQGVQLLKSRMRLPPHCLA